MVATTLMAAWLGISPAVVAAPSPKAIGRISAKPVFFNPSLGQKATIRFRLTRRGRAAVSILDRDRFLIRSIKAIEGVAGENAVSWDGRDDSGVVVPDEAYNLRIETGGEIYDPSENFHPLIEEPPNRIYSRADGVLNYELKRPSRVHAQAGQAVIDPRTKEQEGVVLKTIVDRRPRIAGAIVERWNGFDESGRIYVPDLPHFVVALLATSLPENTIITVGNREQTFFAYARAHRPAEKRRVRPLTEKTHAHHMGLNEFEDHSPALAIRSTPPAVDGVVHIPLGHDLELFLSLDPDRGPYFLKQLLALDVFLGEKSVSHREAPPHPATVTIPGRLLTPGEHVLAVNWTSRLGPVAVNAVRVIVGRDEKPEK